MHFQQIASSGSTGYGMTMACNGVFLMPAYDIENDCAAEDLWYMVHHSSMETLATLTTSPDRALKIAIEIANLREWTEVEAPELSGKDFTELLQKFAGEIEPPERSSHDWEEYVPYGSAA
ncbi:hypothetical protein SAMN05428969_2846 [Devosia sp. YR412]|uniref:hypothetical protein n=1 Tax=Devosia sp. YR412 TaxID=1881030 RepID=UPI0008D6E4D0|nr:hypothetical protein [Devosia sp. YR412]SEQ38247.1 hypothetical protein SAMN05428969_2846 [Devosia sp. YR412]